MVGGARGLPMISLTPKSESGRESRLHGVHTLCRSTSFFFGFLRMVNSLLVIDLCLFRKNYVPVVSNATRVWIIYSLNALTQAAYGDW
ncbi:hypothetical protein F511_19175 [Dorcoceras hygrometricum]|uniref:Uncharacterized protein n=1 Tax=Dorcoceras hygrometricum TaxID=472368 RepID=A0A2Z7AH26_9LAMI|nr:hypothetical protein F511_19175 [Dorcoceras hygrometricum]